MTTNVNLPVCLVGHQYLDRTGVAAGLTTRLGFAQGASPDRAVIVKYHYR